MKQKSFVGTVHYSVLQLVVIECLNVDADGYSNREDEYMYISCFIYVLPGGYDDIIECVTIPNIIILVAIQYEI